MTETPTVTRADLALELHRCGFGSKTQSREIVDVAVNILAGSLRLGKTVHLQGLGRFYWIDTPERQGRHPKTGEPFAIPAGRRLKFKPSKNLCQPLNPETPP
jgi:nucleoid DNA-binding protein